MAADDLAGIELERAKLELERARLEHERLPAELDTQIRPVPDREHYAINPTVLVALIGVLGTVLAGIFQAYNSTALEREKFRSTLLTKVAEYQSREEAVKYLQFLRDTKLVQDIDAPIERYEESPDELPTVSAEYSLKNPSVDLELRSAPIPADVGSQRGLRALKRAIAELNAGAREFGDNGGPWIAKYFKPSSLSAHVGSSSGLPWTMVFVNWCFTESGDTPFKYSPSVRAVFAEFKQRGWLLKADELPKAGDVVFWARGEHSGAAAIVHHVIGNSLYAIAGNVGNLVQGTVDSLKKDNLLGYGRVPDVILEQRQTK